MGVGICFSQFIMTWALCMIYSKKAESFDEISRKILQDMQRGGLNLNTTAFALFLIIVLGTLVITYFASKNENASEFYTAGGD